MNKEEIIHRLKEKYQDEFTIKILTQYIENFEKSLGKYISTEEIINRLKNNITNNFEIVDELINGNLDGQYDIENKKIRIYKGALENLDYLNYLMFHELTHAITTKELANGKKVMGFSFLEKAFGTGLNEAMTEWLTKIRNNTLNEEHISGYDAIVEQIKILSQIVGKENLIHYFFYEPENLNVLLNKNNIDFSKINRIYNIFIVDNDDVYNLANQKKLKNITSYNLYGECQELINIYSTAIGEINSIEDFKRKYQILNSYDGSSYNINNIVSYKYYSNIFYDAMKLVKKGYKLEVVEQTIRGLGISIAKINKSKHYDTIMSKSKNESAIQLYQSAIKDGDDYRTFACENYSMLYDKFSEDHYIPNENYLYDINRYVILGKFLSQHSEYDYDEISVEYLKMSNNINVYRLKTYNGNTYLLTLPFMLIEKISNDSFKIISENGGMQITLNGYDISTNPESASVVNIESGYYIESQLDACTYGMNAPDTPEDKREFYKQKYADIMGKINDRERNTSQDAL